MRRIPTVIAILSLTVMLCSCGGSDESDVEIAPDSLTSQVESSYPETTADAMPEREPPQPGYIRARHILISWLGTGVRGVARSRDEAADLMGSINESLMDGEATFEELAFRYSDCTTSSDSGLLPDFTEGAMVEGFERAAFSTDSGEVSGIIETDFGFHLIKRL